MLQILPLSQPLRVQTCLPTMFIFTPKVLLPLPSFSSVALSFFPARWTDQHQLHPISTSKPPEPEVVAMPPNRSPANILNKIRSNSSTTQLQAEKQAPDCVKEVVKGTVSLENAIAALPKTQQTLGNLIVPIIVMFSSSRSRHKHNVKTR